VATLNGSFTNAYQDSGSDSVDEEMKNYVGSIGSIVMHFRRIGNCSPCRPRSNDTLHDLERIPEKVLKGNLASHVTRFVYTQTHPLDSIYIDIIIALDHLVPSRRWIGIMRITPMAMTLLSQQYRLITDR
jgi:hypothetical protein